jgi:hypothetical protein
MVRKILFLISILSTNLVFANELSSNTYEYKFKIKTGSFFNESCRYNQTYRKTEIKLFVLDTNLTQVNSPLIKFSLKVSLCPKFMSLLKYQFELPLPRLLFSNIEEAINKKTMSLELDSNMGNIWTDPRDPESNIEADKVTAQLIREDSSGVLFKVFYTLKGVNIPNIGSVGLFFAKSRFSLRKIEGFKADSSIPLRSLSIEVKGHYKVNLESNLYRISPLDE